MHTKVVRVLQSDTNACCSSHRQHNMQEVDTRIRKRGVKKTFHEGEIAKTNAKKGHDNWTFTCILMKKNCNFLMIQIYRDTNKTGEKQLSKEIKLN